MEESNTTQHNTSHHTTPHHNTSQHSTTQRNAAQRSAGRHGTARHGTARHDTTRHDTTRHDTTQHNTTQHNTTQHNATTQHNKSAPPPCTLLPPSCSRRMENWDSTGSAQSTVYNPQQTSRNHPKWRTGIVPTPFQTLKAVRSVVNESMVNESMANKSKGIESQVNKSMVNKSKEIESRVNKSMVNKSMVNKSRVNESMVKVLLLPAPCSLLLAPAEWGTGTVLALLKAQCTLHNKQAVIILNGELGQYHLHFRH